VNIQSVEYRGSFPEVALCPKDDRPEFAFIGRSNVGKSSLINALTYRKEVAHTSKKPGKTQLINYFLVNHDWYLVDLPGYGYAKISKKKRKAWEKMIEAYLIKRYSLQCAFVLIDANIPPQEIDVEFINWLGERRIPFVLVYTKTDKSKPKEIEANIAAIREELLKYWHDLPQEFITSSRDATGTEEILTFIEDVIKESDESL
jgi:GTP-binding protein